jgi:hypothetical protein
MHFAVVALVVALLVSAWNWGRGELDFIRNKVSCRFFPQFSGWNPYF